MVAGKPAYWDIQKIAGGNIVYTCPPYVLEPFFQISEHLDFEPEIEKDDVPAEVMDKMMKIPYAMQAYDPNGLALEQFNTHPATVATVDLFTKGFSSLEEFAAEHMAARVPARA